jgi:uncharacterized membrane protein
MERPPDESDATRVATFPEIREVGALAPLGWLAKAWRDLWACPGPSLFYGACFALMGWLVHVVFANAYQYTFALAVGFMLLAPFLTIGLYDIARRREEGGRVALAPTLSAWRENVGAIGIYAIVLTVIVLVWGRASLVTFALFYTREMPSLQGFLAQVVSLDNLEFLGAYTAVAGFFATLVFATSVVSIPMLLGRKAEAITAVLTSLICFGRNVPAMLVWAALILLLTVAGFLTYYVGLVVTIPLLGLATWHAYRELIV